MDPPLAQIVYKEHIHQLELEVALPAMEENTILQLVAQDVQTVVQVSKRMALELVV